MTPTFTSRMVCCPCSCSCSPAPSLLLIFGLDHESLHIYNLCLDYIQMTGSFKERGALNAILQLSSSKKKKGIIAASAGNHALALAYHGQKQGVPVTVVMPVLAPLTKIANCRELGAEVIVWGSSFTEATLKAREIGKERGLSYIHGFDHPPVIAGQVRTVPLPHLYTKSRS